MTVMQSFSLQCHMILQKSLLKKHFCVLSVEINNAALYFCGNHDALAGFDEQKVYSAAFIYK